MKKILISLSVLLILSPTVFAELGDIGYVAKGDTCHMIKYSCEMGTDFYSDDIGCGCQQILSDSQMQRADDIVQQLVSKIHSLYGETSDQEAVLEKIQIRIKNKMFENRENRKFQILGQYIQRKIFDVHGDEF